MAINPNDRFTSVMQRTQNHMAGVHRHGVQSLDAEVIPGAHAMWHLIETDREVTTAAGLAGRRFGVYLPYQRVAGMRKGLKVVKTELMFPGYVFVWVHDLEIQWPRMRAIPGVWRVLKHANGEPVIVSEPVIDYIQMLEHRHDQALSKLWEGRPAKRSRRGKGASSAGEPEEQEITARCYSALNAAVNEPQKARTNLFRRAMGLTEDA